MTNQGGLDEIIMGIDVGTNSAVVTRLILQKHDNQLIILQRSIINEVQNTMYSKILFDLFKCAGNSKDRRRFRRKYKKYKFKL